MYKFCTYFVHILYTFCTEGDGTNDMKMTYRPLLSVVQDFLENKNLKDHWSWTYKQYMVSAASMDGMFHSIFYDMVHSDIILCRSKIGGHGSCIRSCRR